MSTSARYIEKSFCYKSFQSLLNHINERFFYFCFQNLAIPDRRPCIPSPCGPNSICREINGNAVCTCAPQFLGSPPSCRPECTTSADCAKNRACYNQKCIDPCPGVCGTQAICQVYNHNPICTCPEKYSGNPFIRCLPYRKIECIKKERYDTFDLSEKFSFQKLSFPKKF